MRAPGSMIPSAFTLGSGPVVFVAGLLLLMAALVLAIACLNLANLMLARGAARPIMSQLAVATPDTYRFVGELDHALSLHGRRAAWRGARGCVHRGVRVRENDDGHGNRDTPTRAHAVFDSAPLGFLSADAPGGSRIPPSALPASLRRPTADEGARIASANRRPPNVQSQLRGPPC